MAYDDIEEVNSLIQDDIIAEGKIIDDTFKVITNLNLEKMKWVIKHLSLIHKTTVIFKPFN